MPFPLITVQLAFNIQNAAQHFVVGFDDIDIGFECHLGYYLINNLLGDIYVDPSRNPDRTVPNPTAPGLPATGAPEDADSLNRLPPAAVNPDGF